MNALPAMAGIAANHVNIFRAIADSDLMGLLCLIACIILSIISWAIILLKYFHLRAASVQSDAFSREYTTGAGSLEDAFRHTGRYPDSPLSKMMREAYLEMQLENWYADGPYGDEERIALCRTTLDRIMEHTITNEIRRMESRLIFLATTSSVAPFIGLFGTVWGVLGAFQALATAGSAALQSLAPGLATALVATIAGLMAAIPASVFYNYFTNKIAIMISHMDSFALELSNVFQKRIIRQIAEVRQ